MRTPISTPWSAALLIAAAATAAGAGQPAPDEMVFTTVVTPPQIVETMQDVLNRSRNIQVERTYSYSAIPRDSDRHTPVLIAGTIIPPANDESPSPDVRGLYRGFNSVASGSVFPPDCTMGAGPLHVMAGTNAGFAVYRKSNGAAMASGSYGSFFAPLQPPSTFTSDPRVLYDRDSGRWFNMILAISNIDDYSYYMIGVSATSDPNGAWKKYILDSTLNGSNPTGDWSDYPMMGVDKDALYVSANMFPRASGGTSVKLRVIPKAQLINFSNTIAYSDIAGITGPSGQGVFSVHPASTIGATNPAEFMVSTDGGSTINIYGVTNATGTPVLTKRSLAVPSYGFPPSAPQTGGGVTLDTIDGRVQATPVWRDGSLWVCNSIASGSVPAVRWYQISTANWPTSVSLVQSGTISAANTGFLNPSIAVNAAGEATVMFTRSSTTTGASIFYSTRRPADPLGTMSAPTSIKSTTINYNPGIGSPTRWGDYSAVVVDPADDSSFWAFNEYPSASNTWTTWVQNYDLSPNQQIVVDASGGVPGVSIDVTPNDVNGQSTGVTPFARNYASGTGLTLTAPQTSGTFVFSNWIVNGAPSPAGQRVITPNITGFVAATASYLSTLATSVTSSPYSGVPITISTADPFGVGSGDTPILLHYIGGTSVAFTAPLSFNGAQFRHWEINGNEQSTNPLTPPLFGVNTYNAVYGCRGDVSGDHACDTIDLTLLLAQFGQAAPPATGADLSGDGLVNTTDLIQLLAAFGQACP